MNQCCSTCLSIVCATAKWPNGSVTQLPGNSHLKVGHGSFPKEAFGHEVIRCAELYSPNHGVSGTGRIPVPGESAHVSICSTPVEEAHTKWGSSFEGQKRLCLCTSYDLCKVVFAIFFPCSVFQPFLPIHAEVQFCPQYCVTHLYKVCKVLSAAPLALAASCSVKKEERLGKALDHLRAGAKQFQAQNLLYPC